MPNIRLIAAGAVAVAVSAVAIQDYRKVVKEERAKREQIRLESQKEMLAILRAELIVQKKILDGEYDYTGLDALIDDQKFYRMVARFED